MPRRSSYRELKEQKQVEWNAALYIRLSREDGDKEESNSVGNQRILLNSFLDEDSGVKVFDEYVDDGYSGTNFNRPAFQRMMQDIKDKNVNCVVVKDLSRFGRNYIEVGEYIEKIFPFLDVRFISIGDMIDSFKNPQTANNLIVPFKNIINDEYCRDISNKVRASLDMKRKQGKFIGSFATYGYMKDPEDHNHLVIDEYAAEVVRDIFGWYLSGLSIIGISKKLNGMGIVNPTMYKKNKGYKYRHPSISINDGLWCDGTVRNILKNQIYTGCMVQGRNKIKSYKIQKTISVPEEQWIVVPNTHEPIISDKDFENAQILLDRNARVPSKKNRVYVLSGYMRCADCKKAMNHKNISQPYADYCYYVCSTFKKMSRGHCTKHTVRSDKVEKAVLEVLRKQIDLAVDMNDVIDRINKAGEAQKGSKRLDAQLDIKKEELSKIEEMKLGLYPDWKNGDITREEYLNLKKGFDEQIEAIKKEIGCINEEREKCSNGVDNTNEFISSFIKFRNLEKLTREAIVELVEEIDVHEGGKITVYLRFSDAFQQAKEYIIANEETIRDEPSTDIALI